MGHDGLLYGTERWDVDPGMPVYGHTVKIQVNDLRPDVIDGQSVITGRAERTLTTIALKDMNGDGLPDYVVACDDPQGEADEFFWCGSDREDPSGRPANAYWMVWFNNGRSFETQPVEWWLPEDGSIAHITEVDEGRPSLRQCSISITGTPPPPGFGDPERAVGASEAWATDSDSDGVPDANDHAPNNSNVRSAAEVLDLFNWQFALGEYIHMPEQFEFFEDFSEEIEWDFGEGSVVSGACQGTSNPSRGARTISTLMDWDADGRPDFVNAGDGVWHRNLGDRFGDARPLPDWMPGGLSERWGAQTVMVVDDPSTLPTGYPDSWGSSAESIEVYRVQDWNNDGMADLVTPYETDGGLVPGVVFGSYPPPGLMTAVVSESGAESTIEYEPQSSAYPTAVTVAEEPRLSPDYHTSHSSGNLVSDLTVIDPTTGEGARQHTERSYPIWDHGKFLGFESVRVEQHQVSPRFQAELGRSDVQLSRTDTDYLVSRDYTAPRKTVIRTDHGRAPVPGGRTRERMRKSWKSKTSYEQDPYDYATIPSLWSKKVVTTEFGEASGKRKVRLRIQRNEVGLPTKTTHVAVDPRVPEDDASTFVDWVASADGSLWLPSRQSTSGWDASANDSVVAEEGFLAYDGGSAGDPPTLGLLTSEEVCVGPVGSLCSETLLTTFDHTSRGLVERIDRFNESGVLYATDTMSDFVFGGAISTTDTNSVGHTSRKFVNYLGQIDGAVDPNGIRTNVRFDTFGRPQHEMLTPPNAPVEFIPVATTVYDDTAPMSSTKTVFNRTGSLGAESQRVEHAVANGFGDIVETWRGDASGTGFIVATRLVDAFGREARVFEAETRAALGDGPTSAPVIVAEMYADSMGLEAYLSSDIAPGATTRTMPRPGVTAVVDGVGLMTESHTDTHGRIVEVWQGKATPGLVQTARYSYDAMGRVASFVDANGNTYAYSYDGGGRLRQVRRGGAGEPLALVYEYEYEGPFPATKHELQDGVLVPVVEWDADALGRTTEKRVQRIDGSMDTYRWIWDEIDDEYGPAVWNGVRHATEDPSGKTRYFYDDSAPFGELGRLTGLLRANPGRTFEFNYNYDFEGRRISEIWPSGLENLTDYSASGWLIQNTVTTGTPGLGFKVDHLYDSRGLNVVTCPGSSDQRLLERLLEC